MQHDLAVWASSGTSSHKYTKESGIIPREASPYCCAMYSCLNVAQFHVTLCL